MTISLVGAAAADVPTPALVVIGEVVAVREALARCCANSRVVATADLSRRRSRASVAQVCGLTASKPGAFPDAPRARE
jgi:hypothetical protein